jgi:hypothetical protein
MPEVAAKLAEDGEKNAHLLVDEEGLVRKAEEIMGGVERGLVGGPGSLWV